MSTPRLGVNAAALVVARAEAVTSAEAASLSSGPIAFHAWIDSPAACAAVRGINAKLMLLDVSIAPSDKRAVVRLLRAEHETAGTAVVLIGEDSALSYSDVEPGEWINSTEDRPDLRAIAEWGLTHFGHFADVLFEIETHSSPIAGDDTCQWLRTGLGIFGALSLHRRTASLDDIRSRIIHAYQLLDALPDDALTFEDLWNLSLFISLPWTESEIREHAIASHILGLPGDMTGSRKILLWKGHSPLRDIVAFQPELTPWAPVAGDPLRDAFQLLARTPEEANALDLLFKKRITENDLDHIIHALGNPPLP